MAGEILVYVGTYCDKEGDGIFVYRMDSDSGELELLSSVTGIPNPSFLDIDSKKQNLYAVNEIGDFDGKATGAVSAYSIDAESGALTYRNTKSAGGTGPCHLSIDQTDNYVLVANYGGGSEAILPVQEDGSLGEATDFIQHDGSSINPNRQMEPHGHSISICPTNRFAYAADLGLDKVIVYEIDFEGGKLESSSEVVVKGGEGPRHFDFHRSGKFAYLINEMGNTFTAFTCDSETGRLEEIQTVSTLPEDFTETSYCADVHVSADGKFLYGSNRGHDSIAICSIDQETGELTSVDIESTGGENPRNFGIDPTGTFLLAANQDTGNIVTFRRDSDTGRLAATDAVTKVPSPVCVQFVMRDE